MISNYLIQKIFLCAAPKLWPISSYIVTWCNTGIVWPHLCKWDIGKFSDKDTAFSKLRTFNISFQVGSIYNYLRRSLHLQVSPQPRGLFQRRTCDCSNGLHNFMGHILNTNYIHPVKCYVQFENFFCIWLCNSVCRQTVKLTFNL